MNTKKYVQTNNWVERYRENPKLSDDWVDNLVASTVGENGLPGLDAACAFLEQSHNIKYMRYMAEFSIRHPILYILWYKWWLMYSMPKEMRKHLPTVLRCERRRLRHPLWAEFAMHNPLLFLLWLIMYTSFQITVKVVTAPCKVAVRLFTLK